ncbi:shikimate kinase [Frisingicoccus sp.]|uniref:shikimate kinase n=1 Tax=Frisingicoccus sp. TaxID=1918627 RepID=UPI002E9AF0F1|nr:shikimate kinase [Frisingicoccus sp.]
MTDNIILIGMPGAGKSTVGVVLAKSLGYNFIDSDLVIQAETGKRLFEIIEEEGIDGFLAVENQINAKLQTHHAVIATGGSVIYGEEAMEHLKSIGKVVYLKVSYESLRKRLGDLLKRGVAIRNGSTLLDLYNERVPMYERYADITVDAQDKGIREVMEAIEAALEEQE